MNKITRCDPAKMSEVIQGTTQGFTHNTVKVPINTLRVLSRPFTIEFPISVTISFLSSVQTKYPSSYPIEFPMEFSSSNPRDVLIYI